MDADEKGNQFLLNLLGKQHTRLKGLFERHVVSLLSTRSRRSNTFSCMQNEQIKGVEQTKLTSKKRKGVVHFVKHFPVYIGHVENQLIGADGLEIRASVDGAYEKIVQTMFESLKQMAKMDGEGEDKGQLNFHVILIGRTRTFIETICSFFRRKYAPLRCRDISTRNWLRSRVFKTCRGHLRRESQCLRENRTPTTLHEDNREWSNLSSDQFMESNFRIISTVWNAY